MLNFRPKRPLLRNIGGLLARQICVVTTQQNTSLPCADEVIATKTLKRLGDLACNIGGTAGHPENSEKCAFQHV